MKILIINNGSSLGGWRWLRYVVVAIKTHYPETQIQLFLNNNITSVVNNDDYFTKHGIKIFKLISPPSPKKRSIVSKAFMQVKFFIRNKFFIKKTAQLINESDLVFFTWNYTNNELISKINVPIFYIQHDFIFSHFFGLHCGNNYNKLWYNYFKNNVKQMIEKNATFIGSSQHVMNELKRLFPEYKKDDNVVYIAGLNDKDVSEGQKIDLLKKLEINFDYCLYCTNDMHHKNMQAVLGAFYYVKQKYPNIKLIITGHGTNGIRVQVNCPHYCDHIEDENPNFDIKSLGLVSDEELLALMKGAKMLVNCSLDEAACGSGLDAWQMGCPTAISNIPCYLQQVEHLGVKTEFFNPKNCEDIANKMLFLLDNPEIAKQNAQDSKLALEKYTSKDVADEYMKIFEKVLIK